MKRSLISLSSSALLAVVTVLFCENTVQAQVVIDGTTSTTVVVNPNGSVTVGVAPGSSNGVSVNRYNSFNVPKPGLKLDNSAEAARTIVNEVTGTTTTKIEGELEVVGQRAHVIVANPNGIAIDEGRFVNTGRVALTTGAITTNGRQIAPGIFQDNVVSTVKDGVISVNGGGLSGQMDAVDLIAHSIRVDGPITNTNTNAASSIRLSAGAQSIEFDSSVLPGNTELSWGNIVGAGETSDGAVLIEITPRGVLRANRVAIEVSDAGAGVRMAANSFATSRAFTLTADGTVKVTSAQINAKGGVVIRGGKVEIENALIDAGDGVASVVSLKEGVTISDATFQAQDIAMRSAGDLVFDASVFNALNGSMQLDAQGAFSVTGTTAVSFGNLLITADEVELNNGKDQTALTAQNGSIVLTTLGAASAGNLVNNGAQLQGGTKIDGAVNSAGTVAEGAVTVSVKGQLINTSTDDLAVIFGAGGDVSIKTGATFENNRGRILANGDVRLISEGDVLNAVDASDKALDPEIVEFSDRGHMQWWTLFIKRKRSSGVSYDFGTLDRPDQLSTITATGNATISAAGAVVNKGGVLNANGGDLEVTAVRVQTIGLGSGKVEVRKTCVLTCRYEGQGSVAYFGGQMNASGNLKIEASDSFLNRGGAVFAIKDIEIKTPDATLEAVLIPTLVKRPKGLYNLWASKAAWVFLRDQFGTLVAETGNINVKSDNPVKIIGGSLTASNGVLSLENGEDTVRAPSTRSEAPNHTIGFFADIPLLRQN